MSATTTRTARTATARPEGSEATDADDATLREIFDSAAAWRAFSAAGRARARVGLFGNAYLTSAEGFERFARASLGKAQRIVERVAAARSEAEYAAVVGDLDRLSDLLCRVIDLCDFVRTTPPDGRTQAAAAAAWAATYQYMNELNTTSALNDQLGAAMARPGVWAGWGEEARTVAALLRLDFAKSAVDLSQGARDRFVALSQQIGEVGTRFVETMAPAQPWVTLPSAACRGLDPTVARHFAARSGGGRGGGGGGGDIRLPSVSAEAALGLRTIHDAAARRALYGAARTAAAPSVALLERMLGLRAELAQLAGFPSYAHMVLRDRMMARSPEAVRQFLAALARSNGPLVRREMAALQAAKAAAAAAAAAATDIDPWDKDYYMGVVRRQDAQRAPAAKQHSATPLAEYFSVGTVMQGLSRLFRRLYGLRFVARETPPGETWHPDVRRLDVVSDTDGHVAVLYCDLFYRDGKAPNPAHFTVRCSRAIAPDEVAEAAAADDGDGLFASPEAAANDGMATARCRATGTLKQLPTIALVCDFAPGRETGGWGASLSSSAARPALLTFHEVETLFHEMGHAVHSVLARTDLQTVSGTRCATDLAELPSTLMEHFAADPSVLALFARHYATDAPVDPAQVAAGLQRARRFEGLDDENQIVLAMLDQAYHGLEAADTAGLDSTRLFHDLQRRVAHDPALGAGGAPVDPDGTCWQGFFGHLFGYGSTYYSYLFDRVLAERVWRVVFAAGADGGALRRDNGEHLKESLLRWGGARDPWRCVADALRDERVAAGDEAAMALVGSWGTSHRGG